ncbi:helix-turn-helix transcriptional regulator [Draconibacterium orientale]|uniref:helix-turn-helix domain-containing protein n=1 Tax=Draconibacterium orientale TaxID=1168034 RepID=UPI0029C02E66|nr:helix-turn-helix transcriptional regulator [Draconibacterium orientale]
MLSQVFGKVLRDLRIDAGLSQEKLAEIADLDRTYISLLERGLRQPSLSTVFALAQALKIKPHQLIKDVEEEL